MATAKLSDTPVSSSSTVQNKVGAIPGDNNGAACTGHNGDEDLVVDSGTVRKRMQPIVLEEEQYLERMANIIRRDFYPDFPLESLPRSTSKTKQSLTSARTKHTDPVTGQTRFYTPGTSDSARLTQERSLGEDGNLDQFLSTHNSEDNMLYEEIKHQERTEHRAKHPWLYAKSSRDAEAINQLVLPSIGERASIGSTNKIRHAIGWPKVEMKVKQDADTNHNGFNRCSSINHSATRLKDDIFKEPAVPLSESLYCQSAAALLAQKVGVDGRLMRSGDTPRVGGYSFVSMTPTPKRDDLTEEISEDDSHPRNNIMKNSPNAPLYKVPSTPDREQLAYDLADKRSRSKRMMSARYSPSINIKQSPYSLRSTETRLNTLSPASRHLASKLIIKRER